MIKRTKITLSDLMKLNKEEILKDKKQIEEIEKRLEEKLVSKK